jgi:hypothetical protein
MSINPDTDNNYNAQKFGKRDLDQDWTDSPYSSGTYEQEQNPMLGEMPHHPLHVKVVDAQTEEQAAEFTAWSTQYPALAGSAVATQVCPHRYHRDSCRMNWSVPPGYTVWIGNKPDPLSNPAPPPTGFQLTNANNPGAMVYEGQQPMYAVYTFTAVGQLALPATGVPVQNPNAFPVSVAVTGGTVTAVAVNGVTVGAGDGTYVVPAYGSISVTYSVAPGFATSYTGTALPSVATMDQSYGTVQ